MGALGCMSLPQFDEDQKDNHWNLSDIFLACGKLIGDSLSAAEGNVDPLLLSPPPSDLFFLFASENLKAPKPNRLSLINCRYHVSRLVRGSCARWGLPMTRWLTWFPWTWSSTRRWPRRGTRAHRRQAGRRGERKPGGRPAALGRK